MGEHPKDKSIDEMLEEEAHERADIVAEEEAMEAQWVLGRCKICTLDLSLPGGYCLGFF